MAALAPHVEVEFRIGVISSRHGLRGVELRHLVALDAVARSGSFAHAADTLGYTQSAVSQQIAALERLVGARLLHRPVGRSRVTPTPHGELLLRHVAKIIASLQAAETDLSALSRGEAGLLRIGTSRNVGVLLLPAVLRPFLADWPRVELKLIEAMYDEHLLDGLAGGELDLAFILQPADGPFDSAELLHDPHMLVVSADSPLAQHEEVTPADLADTPLIAYHQDFYGVEASLRSHGIEPNIVFRSDDSAILQALAASGIGAAILPSLSLDHAKGDTIMLHLTGVPPRIARIAWHRDRYLSPSAHAFTAAIRAYADTLQPPCNGVRRE